MFKHRKYILDKFEEHLFHKYETYCKAHGQNQTYKGFLTFLIDHDLIPPIVIKRFAVTEEIVRLTEGGQFSKTQTVHTVSDLFNIPERTIWGILKYRKKS